MFKKRWSTASLLAILMITHALGGLAYYRIGTHIVAEKKEKYIGLLKEGSEVYIGVALKDDLLSESGFENCKKAKTFLVNNESDTLWNHFHTENLPSYQYKVFVFKALGPSQAPQKNPP